MNSTDNLILVTDWEKVQADDFYLSDDWAKHTGEIEEITQARELQKEGQLHVAYIVDAKSYAMRNTTTSL